MSNPVQNLFNGADFVSLRRVGPVDHEYRQAEPSGGIDLGASAFASGIPGNEEIDPVLFQKVTLSRFCKWPSINDDVMVWQCWALLRGVDKSQEIVMMRFGLEDRDFRSPNGKEDPSGGTAKRPGGLRHVRHSGPAVTWTGRPRRSCKRDQGHACGRASRDRVPTYLCGERVRGVDQMSNGVVLEIVDQARRATKSPGSSRQWLCDGVHHATSVGERGAQPHRGDVRRKCARLGGAAQDQEIWRHV